MPLSGAEKAKRYIERLKREGKFDDFKKNRISVYKKCRDKLKSELKSLPKSAVTKKLDEMRRKNRIRVQKCRQNKRAAGQRLNSTKTSSVEITACTTTLLARKNNIRCDKVTEVKVECPTGLITRKIDATSNEKQLVQEEGLAYSNNAARRKAVSRANKALPKSVNKQKEVVKIMYDKLFDIPKPITPRYTGLSADVKKAVIDFYERDDISWQSPGRKDFVIIKDQLGKKSKMQSKYLMFPIREIHDKFCKETGSVSLKQSKFFDLRPKHILPLYEMPHNMCLCKYHENFISAVNAINKVIPEMPKYGDDESREFYETFFCPDMTKDCWFGSCKSCKDLFIHTIQGVCTNESDLNVKWYQWTEVAGGRLEKDPKFGSLKVLADYIYEIAAEFFQHCYIKRMQQKSMNECLIFTLSDNLLVIIQIDFSENYKCVSQDEATNAHYHQAQISIFTVTITIGGVTKCYAVVSDVLDHSKKAIVPYIDRMFEELPEQIKKVNIWSDGPTSQFKNKFIAKSIQLLEKKHGKKIDWSFLASSHGKGRGDGVGGALKREVFMSVKSRQHIVRNAAEFVNAVNKTSKVKVILMTADDIETRSSSMNLTTEWENAKDVHGIMKFHHLKVVNEKVVGFLTTSEASSA